MEIIKAKTNGLPLEAHINSVYEAASTFNNELKLGLDNNILRWFSIVHDLGKANPAWENQFATKEFNYRHEIGSIAFIDIVPPEYRYIVKMVTLSHHKPIDKDEKSFTYCFDGPYADFDLYMMKHFDKISEWGVKVKNFLYEQYKIVCEVPTYEKCERIVKQTIEEVKEICYGISDYRGVCMMGDHFGSCYDSKAERDAEFEKLFHVPDISYFEREDENYPLSFIKKDKTKEHDITIAPTGSGKTDASMRYTNNRIFYTLPYQASINAMYQRFTKVFDGKGYGIGLEHGAKSTIDFMSKEEKQLSEFYGLPIKVLTPFQLFGICLSLKGYEAAINDIKGCDVIIDELHTYSGISKTAVYTLIETLKRLGCKIHIITATMPTAMQENVINILGRENTQIIKLNKDEMAKYNRHILHLKDDFDIDDIVKRYESGEKVMVVRNQKELAQNTYSELIKYIPEKDSLILHSKYRRMDRNDIEKRLYEFNYRKEGCLLVSTQVVEVSIDISFDCIYTDCADICSLIQRFGRVNRHRERFDIYKDVFVVKPKKQLIHTKRGIQNNGTFLPYDELIVDKTYEVLIKIDGKLIDENEVQSLIDFVHPEDVCSKMDIYNPFNEDGSWKQKMYSNNINTSIGKELEFDNYIGIVNSDFEKYFSTNDSLLEVPLSGYDIKKLVKATSDKNVYIIPDNKYDKTLGFIS